MLDEATTVSRGLFLRLGLDRQEIVLAVTRLLLVSGATVLIAVTGNYPRLVVPTLLLATLAVVASLPAASFSTPPAALVEGLIAVIIATFLEPASGNLMIYLMAPGLAAGLRGGYRWVVVTMSLTALTGMAMVFRVPTEFDTRSAIELLVWSVLGTAVGVMAAWLDEQANRPDPTERSYAEAVRLLTELEAVTRQLPQGLDVGTLALRVLTDTSSTVGAQRGITVTRNSTGEFDKVAVIPDGGGWPLSEDDWKLWIEDDDPVVPNVRMVGDALIVRLTVSGRIIGYVMLEALAQVTPEDASTVATAAERGAVALEASLLLAEVRDQATTEERSRIAREIHDGIAQEIAFLGYVADELVASVEGTDVAALATQLRAEISRVVGEIRMSVFSLREEVASTRSLGGALSDFARRGFAGENTQLHIVLDESPNRLRPEIEAELLRIAQEALTNVRRHARARNLWLTCDVDAPHAEIRVEDDGSGIVTRRQDSFGLEIMKERARRINASLTVSGGESGGTVVAVTLAGADATGRQPAR